MHRNKNKEKERKRAEAKQIATNLLFAHRGPVVAAARAQATSDRGSPSMVNEL